MTEYNKSDTTTGCFGCGRRPRADDEWAVTTTRHPEPQVDDELHIMVWCPVCEPAKIGDDHCEFGPYHFIVDDSKPPVKKSPKPRHQKPPMWCMAHA